VPLITRLEEQFTQYDIEQISSLSSAYAVRLYELLICWRSTGKTPVIPLTEFRKRLGVLDNEYQRMERLKHSVLELALKQINEHTDITATYEQHKAGRLITGFSFKFKSKTTAKVLKPPKNASNELTDAFVSQHALPGESWEAARARLAQEIKTGRFSLAPSP
jgi:plasmid replication initiation protein